MEITLAVKGTHINAHQVVPEVVGGWSVFSACVSGLCFTTTLPYCVIQ